MPQVAWQQSSGMCAISSRWVASGRNREAFLIWEEAAAAAEAAGVAMLLVLLVLLVVVMLASKGIRLVSFLGWKGVV